MHKFDRHIGRRVVLVYFRHFGSAGLFEVVKPGEPHLQVEEGIHVAKAGFVKDFQDKFPAVFFGNVFDPFAVFIHHLPDRITTEDLSCIQQSDIVIYRIWGRHRFDNCRFRWWRIRFGSLSLDLYVLTAERAEFGLVRDLFAAVEAEVGYLVLPPLLR